jgi:hypothetical protein
MLLLFFLFCGASGAKTLFIFLSIAEKNVLAFAYRLQENCLSRVPGKPLYMFPRI